MNGRWVIIIGYKVAIFVTFSSRCILREKQTVDVTVLICCIQDERRLVLSIVHNRAIKDTIDTYEHRAQRPAMMVIISS